MPELPTDLSALHKQIQHCQLCRLALTRTFTVPGAGDPEARLMFVGEGPGAHEDKQGLPFVGVAGRLLDRLLEGIGLDRSDVFITNMVKCRPPGNRDPEPEELSACRPYLSRQVELINPTIVVTLGRFSMTEFLGPGYSISRIHGQPRRVGGRLLVPLLHPAAALRQPRVKDDLEADFQILARILANGEDIPVTEETEAREEPPEQLSLL